MRLRANRAPVTRLSRKVLLGLGAAAAIGVGGALLFALKPQHQQPGSELYNTNNRNTPDGLANLPRDYAGLPKPPPQLGPPLPGDLGKPILNAGAPAPGMPSGAAGPSPEEQRIAQEREAARNLQTLIHGELHHRIKNTFATVSAIASQSLRNAASLEHAKHAVEGRLAALGRAHDLLMQGSWANASLAETVDRAIEPYSSERFSVTGPDISINSGAVIALAMTFNELCTNATKFGALSVPTGQIELTSAVTETGRFTLLWCEKAGARVEQPTRRSFGTRMIDSLGQQLDGVVRLAYEPTGFVYTLDVPLQSLTAAN